MRKLFIAGLLSALPVTSLYADSYTIDPAHTFPHFAINHLGFSTMHGRFDKTTGTISMDKAAGKGSVNVTIDAASVNTGFKKRNDHLRSPDFLNVGEFPDITYKSTKVTFIDGNAAKVEGNLTMLGTTKPVMLNVTHYKCGTHPMNKKDVCGFDATATIKRSDFGVKYGIPAIGDEMKLTFEVEAVKQ
jgi:polyisoprenoid-binding protein YceI